MATQNKKKKKSGGLWWLIFLLIAGLSQVKELPDLQRMYLRSRVWLLRRGVRVEPMVLVVGAGVVLIVLIVLVSFAFRRRAESRESRPAAGRVSAAAQRRDPRTNSFTQPDAYCVVCDHSGEDHFAHDRSQRIRQLDEWLKNGLIDREEYRVLKSRFERDL